MDKEQERIKKTIKMLGSYKANQVAIQLMQMDFAALDSVIINSNAAVTYDQPSSGKTNKVTSRTEDDVIRLETKRNQLAQQITILQNQVDKIEVALNNMEHPYKTLLKLRYIENRRWSEVYRMLAYSEEYIRTKINGRALNMAAGYLFPEVHFVGLFDEI